MEQVSLQLQEQLLLAHRPHRSVQFQVERPREQRALEVRLQRRAHQRVPHRQQRKTKALSTLTLGRLQPLRKEAHPRQWNLKKLNHRIALKGLKIA